MKLFVYGTLKEGYALNYVLSKSKKIGDYITKTKGFMMTGFWYPYIWRKEGSKYGIKGELYEVNNEEIDKGIFGYVYPNKIDRKSLNIITNTKEKYYEWRKFDDMPKV